MGGPGGGMGGPGGIGGEGGPGIGGRGGEGMAPPGMEAIPGFGEGRMPEGELGQGLPEGVLGGAGTMPAGGAKPRGAAMASGPGGFGGADLSGVLEYTESHGGGTVAVESQSQAAPSIIESGAEVAGIGGFSGKETSVSVQWLEERIENGDIRWILSGGGMSGGLPGDPRSGSESAIDQVTSSCTTVSSSQLGSSAGTLYDCRR